MASHTGLLQSLYTNNSTWKDNTLYQDPVKSPPNDTNNLKSNNPYRNRTNSVPSEQVENIMNSPMDPFTPRRTSVGHAVRTRSLGSGGGVVYERAEIVLPSEDDIVIVNVRLSDKMRRTSEASFDDQALPERPGRRGYIRRLSTRFGSNSEDRFKAVKMPRSAYKAYFAKDTHGNYAGTEPEREWDEADLMQEFAPYQEMPLQGFVHATMCTNRTPLTGQGWTIQQDE